MIGSVVVDPTLYSLDMGVPLADLIADPAPLPIEEVEPQREAA